MAGEERPETRREGRVAHVVGPRRESADEIPYVGAGGDQRRRTLGRQPRGAARVAWLGMGERRAKALFGLVSTTQLQRHAYAQRFHELSEPRFWNHQSKRSPTIVSALRAAV